MQLEHCGQASSHRKHEEEVKFNSRGNEQAWQAVELQEEQLVQASWHRKQVVPLSIWGGAHEEHPK